MELSDFDRISYFERQKDMTKQFKFGITNTVEIWMTQLLKRKAQLPLFFSLTLNI